MNGSRNIALLLFCICPVFLFSQVADVRLKIADSLIDSGSYEQALKLTLQLANENPKNADAFVTLAYCYNNLKENQKCLDAINKAIDLHIDSDTKYSLYYLEADCYSRLLELDKSMKYCEKYLDHYPGDGYGLNLRGYLFYSGNKYEKAIADFENGLKDTGIAVSEKAYALAMLGNCYLEKQDLKNAKRYDSLALALENNDHDANMLLANIYFDEKEFKMALTTYKNLFEKDTSDRTLLYEMANCYYALSDYDKAISLYKNYLLKYPDLSEVTNTIAWILFLQKKYNDALPYANRAIVQDGSSGNAYDTRGCILYKKGEFVSAINDFDKSLQLNKASTNSYYFRGLCFLKINRKPEACKDFEKAFTDKTYQLVNGEAPVEELVKANCFK